MIGIVFLFSLCLFPSNLSSYSSCTNSRVPLKLKSPLKFCLFNSSVCCDNAEDRLQKQFQAMNISDPNCAFLLKSILCTVCDPSSAFLLHTGSASMNMAALCNSSASMGLDQEKDEDSIDFCTKVWDTCANESIANSPFFKLEQQRMKMLPNSSPSSLMDCWSSRGEFCEAFGGSEGSFCFSREAVSHITTGAPSDPMGVCLEKIGNGTYITMSPHPDGSNRMFLANRQGKIWLATIPTEGSKRRMGIHESKPFLDISDRVLLDDVFGMVGMAFHPNFAQNGRFFVSYYCDKLLHPRCLGRCSCNTDVDCDPSKISADGGIRPCQFYAVIAEYTTNGTSSKPSMADRANPSEVRRIFTFGLPSRGVHGGQILIGPDGHLYYMVGDNDRGDNRASFAQDKRSILGKLLRIDIDHIPSAKEIHDLGLWGNYSIPKDNPYTDDKELAPEVWALGIRQPWRCSFDSERPSDFLCGDIGQDQYEEVDMIQKGGNYGWPYYEGPYRFKAENTNRSTPASSEGLVFPVMGYSHSQTKAGSASIIGGFVYRSSTDPCLYGRYLFMDLYAGEFWYGTESPRNGGNFTPSKVGFTCARDSPMQCPSTQGSNAPALGYVLSFGQDKQKDIYLLTTTGVYKVVRPSHCGYRCSTEDITTTNPHSSAADGEQSLKGVSILVYFVNLLLLLDLFI